VSGADIVASHAAVRAAPYALSVAQIGSEAVLKLFPEPEPHPRVFEGLVRFLDLLEGGIAAGPDPVRDSVGLGFQLKLLALAGYLPHLDSCAGCGADEALVGYSAASGGAVCERCTAEDGAFVLRPGSPDAVRVVEATYEHHGGFRLRTLHA